MSRRFQLDPKAPAPARAPPPPPPAPVSRPVAPEAPLPFRPAAPASPAAPAKKRALMLAAVIVGLLLVGGAVAVYVATAKGYPDAYLLESREYPSGVSKARLSASEMDDLGISENPGQLDRDRLEERAPNEDQAEEGWMQVLQDARGARILVLAVQYADEDAAIDAARDARAICSFLSGAVLRDGDVLVGVVPEGASAAQADAVASALKAKTKDLVTVC